MAVVLFVALVHCASAVLRSRAFGWDPFAAPVFSLFGEVAFWAGAALSSAALSRWFFGASAPFGAYYRALGLASAPGILIAVAAVASILAPGVERAVLLLVALYRSAAIFVALSSAAGLSRTQAGSASFAALVGGLAAVTAVTVPLSAALPR